MTPDKARELWADVLADYQDAEMPNTTRDRAMCYALYILAEENEFYGSEFTLLELLQTPVQAEQAHESEEYSGALENPDAFLGNAQKHLEPFYAESSVWSDSYNTIAHARYLLDVEANPIPRLMDVARQCLEIYKRTAAADADIFGGSLLDLMADNIARVSLADLKSAITAVGIYPIANERIKAQIASYR